MTFGQKLQKLRKDNNWSQEELANKITVSRQAVSRWELDEVTPDTENVIQLSELFNVSTDFLLRDSYDSDKDIPAVKHAEIITLNKTNQKWLLKVACVLLLVGVLIIGILASLSQIIPSIKGITYYISFLDFLNMYYLEWILVLACISIVASIVAFIKYYKTRKNKGVVPML